MVIDQLTGYWSTYSCSKERPFRLGYHQNISLNKLQIFKKTVITYIDIAPNNYGIICEYYHRQILTSTIPSNNTFQETDATTLVNNSKIHSFYKLLNIPSTNFKYMHLVIIHKFHKTPIE